MIEIIPTKILTYAGNSYIDKTYNEYPTGVVVKNGDVLKKGSRYYYSVSLFYRLLARQMDEMSKVVTESAKCNENLPCIDSHRIRVEPLIKK